MLHFRSNGDRDWGDIMDEIWELVTDDMNKALVRFISEEEVIEVVFQ